MVRVCGRGNFVLIVDSGCTVTYHVPENVETVMIDEDCNEVITIRDKPRDRVKRFTCNVCQKMFTRKYSLQRHKVSIHGTAESREKKTLKRHGFKSSKKDTTKTIDGLRNHIHESMEEKPQDKMR